MLSGVAELSVFSIQNGNTSKKERCHEVAGLIVLRSCWLEDPPECLNALF